MELRRTSVCVAFIFAGDLSGQSDYVLPLKDARLWGVTLFSGNAPGVPTALGNRDAISSMGGMEKWNRKQRDSHFPTPPETTRKERGVPGLASALACHARVAPATAASPSSPGGAAFPHRNILSRTLFPLRVLRCPSLAGFQVSPEEILE
jgi:hypothetical protein